MSTIEQRARAYVAAVRNGDAHPDALFAALAAAVDAPSTTVVGDLTLRDLGRRIRLLDLHQPRHDWDAPRVVAEAKLTGARLAGSGIWLTLNPAAVAHSHAPLTHPCELLP